MLQELLVFKLKQKSTPYSICGGFEQLPPLLVGSRNQLPPLLLQADSLHDDGSHLEHKKQLKHDETKVHPG